jgi:hypothetical protein
MDKKTADESIGKTVYVIGKGSGDEKQTWLTTAVLGKSYTDENAYVLFGEGKDKKEVLYNLGDIFLTEIEQHKEKLSRLVVEIADLELRQAYKVAAYDRLQLEYGRLVEGNNAKETREITD